MRSEFLICYLEIIIIIDIEDINILVVDDEGNFWGDLFMYYSYLRLGKVGSFLLFCSRIVVFKSFINFN